MKPYEARFPVGSEVRIGDRLELDRFREAWKLHNPLRAEQIGFAGRRAVVAQVAFYHGGDPLYVLEGVPGIWHEVCLVGDDSRTDGL